MKKNKYKYCYLVSYHFHKEGYFGFSLGTAQICRDKKIKSFDDINDLNKFLTETIDGASNLSVFNFKYLGVKRS